MMSWCGWKEDRKKERKKEKDHDVEIKNATIKFSSFWARIFLRSKIRHRTRRLLSFIRINAEYFSNESETGGPQGFSSKKYSNFFICPLVNVLLSLLNLLPGRRRVFMYDLARSPVIILPGSSFYFWAPKASTRKKNSSLSSRKWIRTRNLISERIYVHTMQCPCTNDLSRGAKIHPHHDHEFRSATQN